MRLGHWLSSRALQELGFSMYRKESGPFLNLDFLVCCALRCESEPSNVFFERGERARYLSH